MSRCTNTMNKQNHRAFVHINKVDLYITHQIGDDKVQYGSADGNRAVHFSRHIDLCLSLLGLLDPGLDGGCMGREVRLIQSKKSEVPISHYEGNHR